METVQFNLEQLFTLFIILGYILRYENIAFSEGH